MKIVIINLILIYFLISCTEKIEMQTWPVRDILVVNSFITPDSLFSCYISKAMSLPDTNNYHIENAEVLIYDDNDGRLITKLHHKKNGFYQSTSEKPQINKTYKLEVIAADFPIATAVTSIPEKAVPDSVYALLDAGEEMLGGLVDTYDELKFIINDKNKNTNYFEIGLSSFGWNKVDYLIDDFSNYIELDDSLFVAWDYGKFIEFTNNDPVIANEDLMRYNPGAIIFSDDVFPNSTHQFTIRCQSVKGKRNYFILYSLSEELYKYRKSFFQHQYEQGIKGISRFSDLTALDFAGKAIDVYSNVNGGFGIFAGYNYKMKFSPFFEYQVFVIDEDNVVIDQYFNKTIFFNKDSINE